jgi:hypothetical protein
MLADLFPQLSTCISQKLGFYCHQERGNHCSLMQDIVFVQERATAYVDVCHNLLKATDADARKQFKQPSPCLHSPTRYEM